MPGPALQCQVQTHVPARQSFSMLLASVLLEHPTYLHDVEERILPLGAGVHYLERTTGGLFPLFCFVYPVKTVPIFPARASFAIARQKPGQTVDGSLDR